MPSSAKVKRPGGSFFKMRTLPKAEYRLFKAMVKQYHLDDDSELVTVMLRLVYELIHQTDAAGNNTGEQWLLAIINQWRSDPLEKRVYELHGMLFDGVDTPTLAKGETAVKPVS